MKKFEYMKDSIYDGLLPPTYNNAGLIENLNSLGQDGWELVSIIKFETSNWLQCIFKREVVEKPE